MFYRTVTIESYKERDTKRQAVRLVDRLTIKPLNTTRAVNLLWKETKACSASVTIISSKLVVAPKGYKKIVEEKEINSISEFEEFKRKYDADYGTDIPRVHL